MVCFVVSNNCLCVCMYSIVSRGWRGLTAGPGGRGVLVGAVQAVGVSVAHVLPLHALSATRHNDTGTPTLHLATSLTTHPLLLLNCTVPFPAVEVSVGAARRAMRAPPPGPLSPRGGPPGGRGGAEVPLARGAPLAARAHVRDGPRREAQLRAAAVLEGTRVVHAYKHTHFFLLLRTLQFEFKT